MKRFLHNMSIYSMASPRHKVLSIIQQESDPIEEHIAKIGLFGNTTDNLYHWIGEIAEYLDVICDYSVKTKSGRLKSSDYVRVFDGFGENYRDTKSLLKFYALKFKDKYRKVEVTDEMADCTYEFVQKLKQYVSTEFPKANYPTKDQIKNTVEKCYYANFTKF